MKVGWHLAERGKEFFALGMKNSKAFRKKGLDNDP
jgi:hypothetical protein